MANPRVEIRPVMRAGQRAGYAIWCHVPGCEFADHIYLKHEAQKTQRNHALKHRAQRARASTLRE